MGTGLTDAELDFLDLVDKGKVDVVISPINYGEIKYNNLLSYILSTDLLKNTFYKKASKTGQVLVFNRSDIFDPNGYFSNLLGLANAYSYDKNRQKRIPYYEFNDRLIAALARILNLPLITIDNHLLEKGRREHIKKANKRFGYDGLYSYPIGVEEFLENFNYFAQSSGFVRNPDFRLVSLTSLGTKQSNAYIQTTQVIDSYRGKMDASIYNQLNEILTNEVLNDANPESLISLERRLQKCYDADASFKSDEERFQKTKIAASSYMFTLSALAFFVMEYVSLAKYNQGGQIRVDTTKLTDIENSLSNFGFTFTFDAGRLVSVNYGGISFFLCKKGTDGKYRSAQDILGESINEDYKINCGIDTDNLTPATAMALIPFGVLDYEERTEISKKFATTERSREGGLNVVSNKQLIDLVKASKQPKIVVADLEKYSDDIVKTTLCKSLMYLNRIEVSDKGTFSFT